jgi:hypothetical protein
VHVFQHAHVIIPQRKLMVVPHKVSICQSQVSNVVSRCSHNNRHHLEDSHILLNWAVVDEVEKGVSNITSVT